MSSETDWAALESKSAEEILKWAASAYAPRITFGTGFGVEGCVVIDLIARNALPIDLYTLDTGVLFPQTYELWQQLEAKYGVRIRAVKGPTLEEQAARYGDKLWERD